MASTSEPKIMTFKVDGSITKGKAVKIGTDESHVAVAAATTDKCIGLMQSSPLAAEDFAEVALPGGGAKALLHTTVAAGKLLVPYTDGTLEPAQSASDRVIAMALEDGVAGDLIAVEVLVAQATASES